MSISLPETLKTGQSLYRLENNQQKVDRLKKSNPANIAIKAVDVYVLRDKQENKIKNEKLQRLKPPGRTKNSQGDSVTGRV